MFRTIGLLSALAAVLFVTCDAAQSKSGPWSASKISKALSDRTWLWKSGGGIYFAPGGQAEISYKGKIYRTTWSTRKGAFCYRGPKKDRCWALYEKGGRTYSQSLWQKEYPDPYKWDPAENTVKGRKIP